MPREETFQKELADARTLVNGVRSVLDQLPRQEFKIGIDQELAVQRILLSMRPGDRPIPLRTIRSKWRPRSIFWSSTW